MRPFSAVSLLIAAGLFLATLPSAVVSKQPSFLVVLPSDARLENDICPLGYDDPRGCPVKCFRPDPVCGEDGATYWCGCADAHCAGVRVKKVGFCEGGSDGSGPAGQALLLVHIVWLILLGVFVLFGLL